MVRIDQRESREIIKWGVVFPKNVRKPRYVLGGDGHGYFRCRSCSSQFKDDVQAYINHYQETHTKKGGVQKMKKYIVFAKTWVRQTGEYNTEAEAKSVAEKLAKDCKLQPNEVEVRWEDVTD